MSVMKKIWDEMHPLQQRQYIVFLQSDFYRQVIQTHIVQQYDKITGLDTNQPLDVLGTNYRMVRAELDVWRSMLQFVTSLTLKPLEEGNS